MSQTEKGPATAVDQTSGTHQAPSETSFVDRRPKWMIESIEAGRKREEAAAQQAQARQNAHRVTNERFLANGEDNFKVALAS